jgi:hypothetical protein
MSKKEATEVDFLHLVQHGIEARDLANIVANRHVKISIVFLVVNKTYIIFYLIIYRRLRAMSASLKKSFFKI